MSEEVRAKRLSSGIRRGEQVKFYFDGEPLTAFKGETIATALMAAGHPVAEWVKRMVERLQEAGGWRDHPKFPVFDTEIMKYVLEKMLDEMDIDFWYHVQACDPLVVDGRVRGILVEGKSGREAILANTVIDCTGDGDIAARAGCEFEMGRPEDGACQPATLSWRTQSAMVKLSVNWKASAPQST